MSTSEFSRTPAAKPWSSGRTLTQSQRESKRHRDRITKRAKAEKQKDELEDMRNQIKDLRDLVDARAGTCALCAQINVPPHSVRSPSSIALPDPSCYTNAGLPTTEEAPLQVERLYDQPDAEMRRQRPDDWLFEISTPCSFSPQLSNDTSYTIVQFTNNLLLEARDLSMADICTDGRRSDDAIIHGVLEGWHTLRGTTMYCCPLWGFLSQVDEFIFMHSGLLTRLSMLSTIHTMLVAVICEDLFDCLPAWYRPRPTQLSFPHQLTADYFAWPGLRERLVVSNCEILTDRFFKTFGTCFRLIWPYPISYAYEFDAASGLYSFSQTFRTHIRDIRMWTMREEFFQNYPQLRDDISADSCGSLILGCASGV